MNMAKEPRRLDDEARKVRFTFVDGEQGGRAVEAWQEGIDVRLLLSKISAQRSALYRGAAAGLLLGLAIATLWLTLMRSPSWSASTEIMVANTTLQLSGQDAVVTQLLVENTLLQSQMLLARSHAVMERAIDRIGAAEVRSLLPQPGPLARGLAWLREATRQAAEPDGGAREGLMLSLKDAVSVSRSGASQIIVLRARGADANAAVRLANEVTQAFISESRAINAVVTTSGAFRERIQVLGPTVRMISDAVKPKGRDGPRALLVLALVPLAAGFAGLGLATLRAASTRRIWSAEQLAQHTGGEFFGHVPDVTGPARGATKEQCLPTALRHARAAALERRRHRPRCIGVTSSGGDAGRTTVAKGFALLLAKSGQRVLLADAAFDTRALTRSLSLEGEPGLQDILHGTMALRHCARPSLQPNLDILGAGDAAGDPDPLWPALAQALDATGDRAYDWVILDLPALDPSSAIRAAGAVLDDLILVVRRGAVAGTDLEDAMAGLGQTRDKLLGTMLSVDRRGSALMRPFAAMRKLASRTGRPGAATR